MFTSAIVFLLHVLPLPILLIFSLFAQSFGQQPTVDEWLCPKNGSYFDTNVCDPNASFSCPANFKCRLALRNAYIQQRRANLAKQGPVSQAGRFLCCESRQMDIGQSGLAPAVFPQVPNVTLAGAMLKDPESGRQASVDENGAQLSLLANAAGNFSQLAAIQFAVDQAPPAKGFLHILEAIDQLAPVSALRLHFDFPSFGSAQLDLHSLEQRFPRGFVQANAAGFVPANDFYRRQEVVLVFRSELPLANRSVDIERWMAGSEGKFAKLMWENGSGMAALLGKPWAGLIFNVTTRDSIFPISFATNGSQENGTQMGNATLPRQLSEPTMELAHEPGLPAALSAPDQQLTAESSTMLAGNSSSSNESRHETTNKSSKGVATISASLFVALLTSLIF